VIEVDQAIKGFNRITGSLAAITFKSRKLKSRILSCVVYLLQYSPLVSGKPILLSTHYLYAIGLENENEIIKSELQDKYSLNKTKLYVSNVLPFML